MEERRPVWGLTADVLNKRSRTAEVWSSSLGFGRGTNRCSSLKVDIVPKRIRVPRDGTDPLERPSQWYRDVRLGTCNVKFAYNSSHAMSKV